MTATHGHRQHVDLHRKLALRRSLLAGHNPSPDAAVWVPYCGDGDIASALYRDRKVVAADIDPARVERITARALEERWPQRPRAGLHTALVLDCDQLPPPKGLYAAADFDAYSYPYDAFRQWWRHTRQTDPVVVFFTDAQPRSIMRTGRWRRPDGTWEDWAEEAKAAKAFKQGAGMGATRAKTALPKQREAFNMYLVKVARPWLEAHVAQEPPDARGRPWRLLRHAGYTRNGMLMWGAKLGTGS